MERGKKVGARLRSLAAERAVTQAQLEDRTGISHSTMSGYWSNRLGLGLKNGRRIADALDAELSDLGLAEGAGAVDELALLRRALAALEKTVAALDQRVAALEPARATPRRARPAQRRTG